MSGEDTNDDASRGSALAGELEEPRDPGGRGRLAEDALLLGEGLLGGEYLRVRDALYEPLRLAHGGQSAFPARGRPDADRARYRLGTLEILAGYQRRSPLGLEAEHPGGSFDEAGLAPLLEASPIGGNVAGVADGQGEGIRRAAQRLADFERSRLLALDAVGVYGVDE